MDIRVDDLRGPEIRALLEDHLAEMHRNSPPESVHALDLDGLRKPGHHVLDRLGRALLSWAAARSRSSSPTHGEVKSMRTAPAFRRQRRGRAHDAHAHHSARPERRQVSPA